MTKLLSSVLILSVLFFSFTTSAAAPSKKKDYLTDKYMSMIYLQGLVIHNAEGEREFDYKIQKATAISDEDMQLILNSTQSLPVSSVYQLAEKSHFQNIYVYVGINPEKDVGSKYLLNIVYVNSADSVFALDYEIAKASQKTLTLLNGPDQEVSEASLLSGTFFPY